MAIARSHMMLVIGRWTVGCGWITGFPCFKPQTAPTALASAMEHEKDHMVYGLSSRNGPADIVSIQMRECQGSPATVARHQIRNVPNLRCSRALGPSRPVIYPTSTRPPGPVFTVERIASCALKISYRGYYGHIICVLEYWPCDILSRR